DEEEEIDPGVLQRESEAIVEWILADHDGDDDAGHEDAQDDTGDRPVTVFEEPKILGIERICAARLHPAGPDLCGEIRRFAEVVVEYEEHGAGDQHRD